MSRTCTICTHKDRHEIDKALLARRPFRHIAGQHGVSTSALVRHSDDHIPAELLKAAEAAKVTKADDLLAQVTDLRDAALRILRKAEDGGEHRDALAAVREARECLRLLGELAGKLQSMPTVNVLLAPQFIQVQAAILMALEPHPEARLAVANALGSIR